MIPSRRPQGTALIVLDSVKDCLPYVVRRDDRIIAAFDRRKEAEDWAEGKSYYDRSLFEVAAGKAYRDGEEL
jgi:hypothetical protein